VRSILAFFYEFLAARPVRHGSVFVEVVEFSNDKMRVGFCSRDLQNANINETLHLMDDKGYISRYF